MLKKMTLQKRLLVTGCLMTAIPLLIITMLVYYENMGMIQGAVKETTRLNYSDMSRVTESVYAMADSNYKSQQIMEKNMKYYLNVAREALKNHGGLSVKDEKVTWNAVNQITKASQNIELPKVNVGDSWLGQVKDTNTQVPFVDYVTGLVGATCTVFQRMNEAGDMLRIATTVRAQDGTRAIGTFIPATSADGSANPVIASVMKGQVYSGRAFVVDNWYVTSYEPILDAERKVTGMLYVGVPQESMKALSDDIKKIKVFDPGPNTILISNGDGTVNVLSFNGQANKVIGTDANGNIALVEMAS